MWKSEEAFSISVEVCILAALVALILFLIL